MPRFFIPPTQEESLKISGQDALHISRSLRMRTGDEIILSDGEGWDYIGEITGIGNKEVAVKVIKKVENTTEPKRAITLYQALPKGDKFSFITEKAVELGVARIVPVLTSRCISRPNPQSMDRKIERYRRAAEEAAKQSDRGRIPTVDSLLPFEQALEDGARADIKLFFYEEAQRPLQEVLTPQRLAAAQSVSMHIGSEGGFSPEEVALAKAQGYAIVSLGPRILRTETAPLAALSALQYASGEF